jgi:hypothetical protein
MAMQVNLSLYAKEPVAGVARLAAQVAGAPANADLEIEFAAEGRAERLVISATADGAGAAWTGANIFTHHYGDGETTFVVTARVAGSNATAAQSKTIRIENGETRGNKIAPAVRESLKRTNVPPLHDGLIESTLFDYADAALVPWYDREDAPQAVGRRLAAGDITGEEAEFLLHLVREGYAIAPQRLSDALVDRVVAEIDKAVEEKYQGYQWGESQRLTHLHQNNPAIREVWTHPYVMRLLQLVFGAEPRACQTLTYVFGSQQELHQDTVHLTPFPAGYMCGVWVAMEDVREGSGELEVLPGSHKFDRVYRARVDCAPVEFETGNRQQQDWTEFGQKVGGRWRDQRASHDRAVAPYMAKKGQILFWHENLMHGCKPRYNKDLSRKSVVSHYFAEGALAYYDTFGFPGTMESFNDSTK